MLKDVYGLSEDTSIQLVDRPDQLLLFQVRPRGKKPN